MLLPGRRLPFGDAVIGRAFDLRPGERRSIVPASAAMREIAGAEPSAVVRLYDEFSGFRRYSPPTPDDVDHARRSLGDALARGDIVLLRPERRLRGAIVLPPGFVSEPPPPPASPPVEEKTSWFEVTVVDAWGQPVDGLNMSFSAAGDRRDLTTNGAGTTRVEGIAASHASIRITSSSELRKELRNRAPTAKAPIAKRADDSALLVVGRDDLVAQLEAETPRTIAVVVLLTRVRLIGMHFDTNKAFLRESAMRGIRKVVQVYEENPNGKLLIVGHTDTKADDQYNLDLSVERAESVKAYLKNDVPLWEAWFRDDKPIQKRWGDGEVAHMISVFPCEQSVAGFQEFSNETRGTSLKVDGIAGPRTRRALIEAYMSLEGTTLPASIEAVVHGCGKFFPEEETGDNVEDAENRRVEIFCFHDEITPPVPGKKATKGEPQYPQWKNQVTENIDVETGETDGGLGVRVFDDKTLDRVPNAGVWVFRAEVQVARAITNDKGVAVFASLPVGEYSIVVGKEGSELVTKPVVVVAGKKVVVETLEGETEAEAPVEAESTTGATAASVAKVPLSLFSGIYFDPDSAPPDKKAPADFAKFIDPIFNDIQRLTRDTLALKKVEVVLTSATGATPPPTKLVTRVIIAVPDGQFPVPIGGKGIARDVGTNLVRDLTDKRKDCSVTLPTLNDKPLVEVRIGNQSGSAVSFGQTEMSTGGLKRVVVGLQTNETNNFSDSRGKTGIIGRNDGAFWITNKPIKKGNGQSKTTGGATDPALSQAIECEPELASLFVVLAHELVHAWRDLYGPSSAGFAGSLVRASIHPKEFAVDDPIEELKTVGLCDPSPSFLNAGKPNDPRIPTENGIRFEQFLPLRAAYQPIQECPFRSGVEAQVQFTTVQVTDAGDKGSNNEWQMSVVVEVVPPNVVTPGFTPKIGSGPFKNGGSMLLLVKDEHVFAGSELKPHPKNLFKCDLADPGQRITFEVTGTYTDRTIIIGGTFPLNSAKDSPPYQLPIMPSPDDELPKNNPKSQSFTMKSSTANPKGGAYSITCQINTMAYVDPWKNLWDTSLP